MKTYKLYFDGQCPFCKKYSKLQALRKCINLQILDGNLDKSFLEFDSSLDFEKGIILIDTNSNKIFQGQDALIHLSSICENKSLLLKLQSLIFNIPILGSLIYKTLLTIRNIIKWQ